LPALLLLSMNAARLALLVFSLAGVTGAAP
jgi:hypothetical protein